MKQLKSSSKAAQKVFLKNLSEESKTLFGGTGTTQRDPTSDDLTSYLRYFYLSEVLLFNTSDLR